MTIECANRCLRIRSYAGAGTPGNPYRKVTTYIDLSGQILDVVDEYINEERMRLIADAGLEKKP
jgi:hypothetical protein